MKIKVGTRGSKLAITQTNWVMEELHQKHSELTFEMRIIKTKGDLLQHVAIDQLGDKGAFVREIEAQLLSGEIDLAVHSMKDMPSEETEGLCFAKVPRREDRRDVLVLRQPISDLSELPQGAVIGTGSKRRQYQLLTLRPDLQCVPIRGNIDTRMRKIEEEGLDGIILAAAGIKRIGAEARISYYLSEEQVIPSPGQGALALQMRATDQMMRQLTEEIMSYKDQIEVEGERGFLQGVNGGCNIPIGAYAALEGELLWIHGLLGDEDGTKLVKESICGTVTDEKMARKLGGQLAKRLGEVLYGYEG